LPEGEEENMLQIIWYIVNKFFESIGCLALIVLGGAIVWQLIKWWADRPLSLKARIANAIAEDEEHKEVMKNLAELNLNDENLEAFKRIHDRLGKIRARVRQEVQNEEEKSLH
jgi:hypothetical protein